MTDEILMEARDQNMHKIIFLDDCGIAWETDGKKWIKLGEFYSLNDG